MTINELALLISVMSLFIAGISLVLQHESMFPKIKLKTIQKSDAFSKIYRFKYSEETKSLYLFAKFEVENYSPIKGSIHHCRLVKPAKDIFPLNQIEIDQLPQDVKTELDDFNVHSSKIFDKCFVVEPYQSNDLIFVFKSNADCVVISRKKFKIVYKNFDVDRHHLKLKFYLSGLNFINNPNLFDLKNTLRKQRKLEVIQETRELENRFKDTLTSNNLLPTRKNSNGKK